MMTVIVTVGYSQDSGLDTLKDLYYFSFWLG